MSYQETTPFSEAGIASMGAKWPRNVAIFPEFMTQPQQQCWS
jgi:hypothetical protein